MGGRSPELTPEEQSDLINELKRVAKDKNLAVEIQARDTGQSVRACPGCIACTCMICI